MVATIGGGALGVSLGSLASLGQRGQLGSATQGRSGERVYVNAATGNLVLQGQDDLLVSRGLDIATLRTYNSQGQLDDDNGDNWLGAASKRVILSGSLLMAGSSVTRIDSDGARAVYTYDSARGNYVSTDGTGAHDTIGYDYTAGRFVWTDGGTGVVERYESGGQGRLLSATDTNGNQLTYAYNASGQLAHITNGYGEATYFEYVGNQLVRVRTALQMPSGTKNLVVVRYTYDTQNRLSAVYVDLSPDDGSLADGNLYKTTYTYDGTSKRIASITQSDGSRLSFTYVQVGAEYRVETVTDALNRVTRYAYDTVNRRTTITDPLGLVSALKYDTKGQLTEFTAPAVNGVAQVTSYTYNTNGDLIRVVDPQNLGIDYEYDANGNATLQRDAAGNTLTRTYDSANRLLTETVYLTPDPDGSGTAKAAQPLTTRYVYDAAGKGRLRFVLSAEGRVSEYGYDGFGQRISKIEYAGAAYNVAALAATAVPAEGSLVSWAASQDRARTQRTDYAYDARGQLQRATAYSSTDASGNGVVNGAESVTQYVYDSAGRLLSTYAPRTGTTTYTYDGLGRQLTTFDTANRLTVFQYDDANNKTVLTQAHGLVTTSVYDKAGQLVSVVDSSAAAQTLGETRYFYDAGGRLRMTQDPTGVRRWHLYDEAGRKVADIDANGSLTEYVYDKNNRLTFSVSYATAVSTAGLVNASGQPVDVSLASLRPAAHALDAKTWYAYDSANRLVKTVDPAGAVTETQYDGASRVVKQIRSSNVVATTAFGTTLAPADIAPKVSSLDRISRNLYDGDGLLRGTLDGEGYLTELRYDHAGRLVEKIRYATATPSAARASGALGALIPASDPDDQRSVYFYDAQGRQIADIDAEGYLTERVYDTTGNLTRTVRYAAKVSAAYTPASNPATLRPTAQAEDRVLSWGYDALNRLIKEVNAEGLETQYKYDLGGRVEKTTRIASTSDQRAILATYDLQGRLTGELSAEGAALITAGMTQAQIDAIWAQHGTHHTYDAAGRRTSTTDAAGHKTLFYYNVDGQLTHTINALGEVEERKYNALNQFSGTWSYGTRISTADLGGGLVDEVLTARLDAVRNTGLDGRTTVTYRVDGRVATDLNASGYGPVSHYNAFGEKRYEAHSISSGRSIVQTMEYDRRGLLVKTTADTVEVKAITTAEYDAFGRAIRTVDPNGNVRQNTYDRLGRVVQTVDALGKDRSTTYDAFDRVLTSTDALDNVTRYSYNTAARSVTVTTPENVSVTTTRNRYGEVHTVKDGRGFTTTYTYDRNGNLERTDLPLAGHATSSTYDGANRLIETTDANGNKVTYAYDAANRLMTRTVDPAGLKLVTKYEYNARGQQVKVTDANNVVTETQFDLNGRMTRQIVDPGGLALTTTYGYDRRGKVLSVTAPNGSVTAYEYDLLGRRTLERVDPNGLNLTRSYQYDQNGNVVASTDPNGNVTRFTYDAENRQVHTIDALGQVRELAYDDEGRVIRTTAYAEAITVGSLPAVPTAADVTAALAARTPAAAPLADSVEHRVYDKDGRLRWTVDGVGGVVRYTYDKNGKVVDKRTTNAKLDLAAWVPGTEPVITYSSKDEVLRYVYDALNRVTYTVDNAGGVIHQKYDANGNVIERIAYAGKIPVGTAATDAALAAAVALAADSARDQVMRYAYDGAGRQVYSVNALGQVTQVQYDGVGRVVSRSEYAQPIALPAQGSDDDKTYTLTGDTKQFWNSTFASIDFTKTYKVRVKLRQLSGSGDIYAGVIGKNATGGTVNVNGSHLYSAAKKVRLTPEMGWVTYEGTISGEAAAGVYDTGKFINGTRSAAPLLLYNYGTNGVPGDLGRMVEVDTLELIDVATGQVVAGGKMDTATTSWGGSGASSAVAYRTDDAPLDSSQISQRLRPSDNDRVTRHAYDAAGRQVYSVDALGQVTEVQYDDAGNVVSRREYAQPIALPAQGSDDDKTYTLTGDTKQFWNSTFASIDFTKTYKVRVKLRQLSGSGDIYAGVIGKNATGGTVNVNGSHLYSAAKKVRLTPEMGWVTYEGTISGEAAAGVYDTGKFINGTRSAAPLLLYNYGTNGIPGDLGRMVEVDTLELIDVATGQVVAGGKMDTATTSWGGSGASSAVAYRTDDAPLDSSQISQRLRPSDDDRVTRYAYDQANRQTYVVDAVGGTTRTDYDGAGNAVATTRYATPISTTGLPAVAAEADVAARIAANDEVRIERRAYDAANRLVYTVDALGYVKQTSYDGVGRVASTTEYAAAPTLSAYNEPAIRDALLANPTLDRTNTFTYDGAGRLTASKDALGYTEYFTYDGVGRKITFKNKKGAVWSYVYNGSSQMIAEVSPKVALTTVVTTADGKLQIDETQSQASVGIITRFEYDALGNLLTRIEASGLPEERTTRYEYDALGRQVRTLFPAVNVYSAAKDNLTVNGATSVATRTENLVTLYTQTYYDSFGNAVASRDVAGHYSYKAYDKAGQVAYEVDAMGFVTAYGRNAFGETTHTTRYAQSITAATGVDESGNPIGGRSFGTKAPSESQIAGFLAPLNHSADRLLLTEYDRLGRAVKVVEPTAFTYDSTAAAANQYFMAGKTTRNSYNGYGDLVQVSLLRNALTDTWDSTTYYYDRRGQRIASVDALGYVTEETYDAVGNVAGHREFRNAAASWNLSTYTKGATDADDRYTEYVYDRGNRKTAEKRYSVEFAGTTLGTNAPRATLTTSYAYDAVGNLTRTIDADGKATYSLYDLLGRVTAVTAPTRTSTVDGSSLTPLTVFRRDAYGNVVAKIDYAKGATAANSATPLATDAADRTELTRYDSHGHAIQVQNANGDNRYQSYDAGGRVAKEWMGVTGNDGVTRTMFRAYQYDALGRNTSIKDPASTTVFRGGLQASFASSSRIAEDDGGYHLRGTNSVTLGWSSLVDPAGGMVRVQIVYMTVSTAWSGPEDEFGHAETYGFPSEPWDRVQDYSASSAASGVTMSWTDSYTNRGGGIDHLTYIRVWQANSSGVLTSVWEGTPAQATGSGVATVTQQQAGVVDTAFEYNAFGEMTRRGVNGGRQEYFDYNNAGQLWRTNADDGVDRVAFYDLQGRATADIRSGGIGLGNRDLQVYASADQLKTVSDVRRTDTVYDALGRATQQLQAKRSVSQGGVTVRNLSTATSIVSASPTITYDESSANVTWSGTNVVTLGWTNLLELGSGDVRLDLEYMTRPWDTRVYDEFGTVISGEYHGAVLNSLSGTYSAEAAATGVTVRWQNSAGPTGGISSITRMKVWKKDLQGEWHVVIDRSTHGEFGHVIEAATPADPTAVVQLQLRPAGSTGDTGWASKPMINFGKAYRYDTSGLAAGAYEYRVLITEAGQGTRTASSGTLSVVPPALTSISTSGFNPAGIGVPYFAWASPGASVAQQLRYRVLGSTGAWSSLTVAGRGKGYDGVDVRSLANGSYEFELLWTRAGESTPYAHATGRWSLTAEVAPVYVPPVNYPHLTGTVIGSQYVIGYDESGNPTYGSASQAPKDESGNYLYGGAVHTIEWAPANTGYLGSTGFWYRVVGGGWRSLAVSSSTNGRQLAVLSGVAVGNYEFQTVARDRHGNVVAWATGNLQIRSSGSPVVSVNTPPYTPGYTIPGTPAAYSATMTTASNPAAISVSGAAAGADISQSAATNGDTRWLRPLVNRTYDRWGNVLTVSDPRAANWITHYTYNANNQLIQEKRPDADGNQSSNSPILKTFYDKLGRQVATTDANGNVNGVVYDAGGNVVQEIHADGGIVNHSYNAFGERVKTRDAMNKESFFVYDKLGRLLQTIHGTARVYRVTGSYAVEYATTRAIADVYTYDQAGRKLTHTNGNYETIKYTYDLRGNIVETIKPVAGTGSRSVFDARGRKTAEVDGNNYSQLWRYDHFGQLQAHTDVGGATYQYTYDRARQLLRQTNSRGQNLSYVYDAAGQVTQISDSTLGHLTTYAYDLAGNRLREKTVQYDGALGKHVAYQDNQMAYDALGRLRWASDSHAYVHMTYDKQGNRKRIQTHTILGTDQVHDSDRWFVYDKMNRQEVVDGVNEQGDLGQQGHRIAYDENGNRISDTYWGNVVKSADGSVKISGYNADGVAIYTAGSSSYIKSTGLTTEVYRYDALNRLQSIVRDGTQVDIRYYDGAGRAVLSGTGGRAPAGYVAKVNEGVPVGETTGTETRVTHYDLNGQMLFQRVIKNDGSAKYNLDYRKADGTGNYDRAGNVLGYKLINYDGDDYTNTYTHSIQRFEGYKQGTTSGTSTKFKSGSTSYQYDKNGHLVGITDSRMSENSRWYVNDAQGRILFVNQGGYTQRQMVINGEVLGRYGYALDPMKPRDDKGRPLFKNSTDFNFGYQPINGSYSTTGASMYTVNAGDTLQAIARSAYGDSQLWYRIAEANGLTGNDDLIVGQTLIIPSNVSTSANRSDTFKPYNAAEVVGDTTPHMPLPKDDCGPLGQILMIVVTVVVAYFTFGAAVGALGTVGAGALAGAAGALAGQVVGNATGAMDGFDWKGIALGALGGAVGGGLAGLSVSSSQVVNVVVRAAIGNAMSQGIAVATGLQEKFNWRGVAAAAVGAGVAHAISNAVLGDSANGAPLRDDDGNLMPGANVNLGRFYGSSLAHTSPQLAKFVAGTLSGAGGGMAAAAMRGGKIAISQVMTDAFGNALGNAVVDGAANGASQQAAANRTALNRANQAADPDYYGSGTASSSAGLGRWDLPPTDYSLAPAGRVRLGTGSVETTPTPEELQAAFRASERGYRQATDEGAEIRAGDTLERLTGGNKEMMGRYRSGMGLRSMNDLKAGQRMVADWGMSAQDAVAEANQFYAVDAKAKALAAAATQQAAANESDAAAALVQLAKSGVIPRLSPQEKQAYAEYLKGGNGMVDGPQVLSNEQVVSFLRQNPGDANVLQRAWNSDAVQRARAGSGVGFVVGGAIDAIGDAWAGLTGYNPVSNSYYGLNEQESAKWRTVATVAGFVPGEAVFGATLSGGRNFGVGNADTLAGNSWSGAAKLHATSDLWTTNPGGPRSLESAINFADEHGSFGTGLVDYFVIAPNQVSVDFGGGLRIKYVSVEDAQFTKLFGNDKYAYYETKQYPGLLDPSTPLTYNDLFGKEALVRVRQSIFESDRGLTAVLGHEYYEINGLFNRGATPYRDLGSTIDSLHNGAVNFGDDLVRAMIDKGF